MFPLYCFYSVDQQLEHEPQHQQHPSHPPMEQIQQFGQQRCLEGIYMIYIEHV